MSEPRVPPTLLRTRAERIRYAVYELEGTSLQKVERALGFSDGQLSRYAGGKRGGSTVDVDKMTALANHLHVEFEWLVRGVGPVRTGGRDSSPFEEAMVLARRSETPEEAVQSAWDRFKDRAATMTALDWAAAIHNEERVLGQPRVQPPAPIAITVRPGRIDKHKRPKPQQHGDE